MSVFLNIPEIAITPEDDEDDDNDNLLNLAEALTDVEELYVDQVSIRRNSFRKKLRIKVTDNDGYNTALEDVEASDEDDVTPTIQRHDYPISLEDLDLEQFSTEENYGISRKNTKDFEYYNLQTARTNETLLSKSADLTEVSSSTDVEYYDTEIELKYEEDIPDAEFYSDNSEAVQIITITDELQGKKQSHNEQNNSDDATPLEPSVFPNTLSEEKNFKAPFKRPPTFSQMMKSKRNAGNIKIRKRKRNKINAEPKKTDEYDSSENDSIKPASIRCILVSNSLNYESDVEEENKLKFPVCKKTFSRNKQQLKMPDFYVNDKTDVEDFECEAETYSRRISVDGSSFQKQLDEMASCYSFTKDKNETKLMQNEDEELVPSIMFSAEILKNVSRGTTSIIGMKEDELTDVENISNTYDQAVNSEYETEEELFKGFLNEMTYVPEVVLPPPMRILVISEENKTIIPTVRILPLDGNHHSDSDFEEKSTEDESMDFAIEFNSRGVRKLRSPQLPLYESENVKMIENTINSSFNKLTIEDVATDVEYLDTEPSKWRIEKESIFLSPNNSSAGFHPDLGDLAITDSKSILESGSHTEFEYFDSSDDESFLGEKRNFCSKLKYLSLNPLDHTDTEDLVASTDDENHYSRAETATPHDIRKVSDEASAIHTDTENSSKMGRSSTEEVMYLKGGGFQDIRSETDQYFGDVMDAWEYFNQGNSSSIKEWNATADSQTFSKSHNDTVKEDKSVDSELQTMIISSVSNENILLSSKSEDCIIGCPLDYDSYSQIDAMLDRMFIAVDEINLSQDFHTNSLTLVPSSDALIEIPIKKSKSKRTFTVTADIFVDEDVPSFGYPISRENDDTIISDDVDFDSSEYFDSFYKDDIYFGSTLNTHKTTENLYEPVNLKTSHYSGDSDYIWWEGTYRNLSVVVEDDEENNENPQIKDLQNPTFSPSTSHDIKEYCSESSQVFSSMSTEESDSDHSDKMIKAEVKLRITSKEDGLDAIEVKSVKEFMLKNDEALKGSTDRMPKKKLKLKKKLMNMLDQRKSDSETVELSSIDKSKKKDRKKTARPSFTLPRIFIKNSNPGVSSSSTSEFIKEKNDIIAKPNENFPLSLNNMEVVKNDSPKNIDLFDNMPFYPVYTARQSSCKDQTLKSITYISPSEVTISEAYCNWSDTENHRGKTTSTQFFIELEGQLLGNSPFRSDTKKITTQTNEPNAFLHFGKEDYKEFGCTSTSEFHGKGEISNSEVQISKDKICNSDKELSLHEIEKVTFSFLNTGEKYGVDEPHFKSTRAENLEIPRKSQEDPESNEVSKEKAKQLNLRTFEPSEVEVETGNILCIKIEKLDNISNISSQISPKLSVTSENENDIEGGDRNEIYPSDVINLDNKVIETIVRKPNECSESEKKGKSQEKTNNDNTMKNMFSNNLILEKLNEMTTEFLRREKVNYGGEYSILKAPTESKEKNLHEGIEATEKYNELEKNKINIIERQDKIGKKTKTENQEDEIVTTSQKKKLYIEPLEKHENSSLQNNFEILKEVTSAFINKERYSYGYSEEYKFLEQKLRGNVRIEETQYPVQWPYRKIKEITNRFVSTEVMNFYDVKCIYPNEEKSDQLVAFGKGNAESNIVTTQNESNLSKKHEKYGFMSFFVKESNEELKKIEVNDSIPKNYENMSASDNNNSSCSGRETKKEYYTVDHAPLDLTKMNTSKKQILDSHNQKFTGNIEEHIIKDAARVLWPPEKIQNITNVFLKNELRTYHDVQSKKNGNVSNAVNLIDQYPEGNEKEKTKTPTLSKMSKKKAKYLKTQTTTKQTIEKTTDHNIYEKRNQFSSKEDSSPEIFSFSGKKVKKGEKTESKDRENLSEKKVKSSPIMKKESSSFLQQEKNNYENQKVIPTEKGRKNDKTTIEMLTEGVMQIDYHNDRKENMINSSSMRTNELTKEFIRNEMKDFHNVEHIVPGVESDVERGHSPSEKIGNLQENKEEREKKSEIFSSFKRKSATERSKDSEITNINEQNEKYKHGFSREKRFEIRKTNDDAKKQNETKKNYSSEELEKITNDFLIREYELYQDVKYIESRTDSEKIEPANESHLSSDKNEGGKKHDVIYQQKKRQDINTTQRQTSRSNNANTKKIEETSGEVEKSSFFNFFIGKSKENRKTKHGNEDGEIEVLMNMDPENLSNNSSLLLPNEKEENEYNICIIETDENVPRDKVHAITSGDVTKIEPSKDKNQMKTNEFFNTGTKSCESSIPDNKYVCETHYKTMLESFGSHKKSNKLENADGNIQMSNTIILDSSETHENGDEPSNENTTKTIKKSEKTGILTFFKVTLKKGSDTDSVENLDQTQFETSFPEVEEATSSFLLEEKLKYEDSQINFEDSTKVITQNGKYYGKTSKNEAEDEYNHYEVKVSKMEDLIKENNQIVHEQSEISKQFDQNSYILEKKYMEPKNKNSEIASITQYFLEIENNNEYYNRMSNVAAYKKKDVKMNNIENENIFGTNREHHPEKSDYWFSPGNIEKTKNFLKKEKQLYDSTTSDSDKESVKIDKQKSFDIQRNEIHPIPSLDTQQKSDAQVKTNKKRGILGFLKKKSRESDDLSYTEIKMKKDTNGNKKRETRKTSLHNDIEDAMDREEKDTNEIAKKNNRPHMNTNVDQDIIDSKKGILGFLFKKKKPKYKEETSTYHKADDLKILEDTKTFLHKETEIYHGTNRGSSSKKSDFMPYIFLGTVGQHEDDAVLSDITEQKLIIGKVDDNTSPYTQLDFSNNKGTRNGSFEKVKHDNINPECTAFDFIKDEIEIFENTKAPGTSKVDSSIIIKTEIETIDSESPRELITKKIIISEKLIQKNYGISASNTSDDILEKLIDVNDELKALLTSEKKKIHESKYVIGLESKTPEEVEETAVNEFAGKMATTVLTSSNIVEDVSVLESMADRVNKEIVTDLDDLTSDESYPSDSRKTKEVVQVLKEKYPEYSNEHIPIIEDDIVWRSVGVEESIIEEKSMTPPKNNEEIESSKVGRSNKKGSITKLNEPESTMSSISNGSQVMEDLIKDLREDVSSSKMRKPIFRIESEEENSTALNEDNPDTQLNNILQELQRDNEDCIKNTTPIEDDYTEKDEEKNFQSDIEIIEEKLSELGKALDTLEQFNGVEPSNTNEIRDRKLRRVERKFERMASESIELSNNIPVVLSNSVESQHYQQLVSPLSQDEVMSSQGDFNNLWEEYTFSKSDEWDSKTPDSQAEVPELPQGNIVYMAPVKLNVNHSVNKAGVEVDVIPIMPSPNISPKAKKKRRRNRSTYSNDSHSSSTAKQHSHSYLQDSITKRILRINPMIFSFINGENHSHFSENLRPTKFLDDIYISTRGGPIMNAVVDWLGTLKKERSPFEHDIKKNTTEESISSRKSSKKNNNFVDGQSVSLNIQYIDTCKELTEASKKITTNTHPPQPKPRQQKSKEQIEEEPTETDTITKQISPVRDDILDDNFKMEDISYQDKKKFWENIAKEPSMKQVEVATFTKRNSVQDSGTAPIPKPRGTIQFSKDETIYPIDQSESEKTDRTEETEITEIEASEAFSINIQSKEVSSKEIEKSESVETEESSSQGGDNAGYISDSGDVEHYISDSEIEDRVPQIRERQMSVFVPPSVSQRTRYERSASLPTEDLYEISARSTIMRKQYYEEQIKKEMIKEQLTIELEDEGSPERKSIASSEIKPEETIIIKVPTNDKEEVIFESEQEHEEESAATQQNSIVGKDETIEIHVDKSETEKSEKVTEISFDPQIQDIESPSHMQENIPEITYTLSGLQKRISEESEDDDNDRVPEITYTLSGIQRRISEESEDENNDKIPEITYTLSGIQKRMSEESEDDEITSNFVHKQGVRSDDIQEKVRTVEKSDTDEMRDHSPTHKVYTVELYTEREFMDTFQSNEEAEEMDTQIQVFPQIDKKQESSVEQQISELQIKQDLTEHLEKIETQSKKVHVDEPEVPDGVVTSSSEEVKCQQEEIDESRHCETMNSAAKNEKVLAENILDDSIADIDLESEDLKQIVSRLESMHKFKKLKGKLPGTTKQIRQIQEGTASEEIKSPNFGDILPKLETAKEKSKQKETKEIPSQSPGEIEITTNISDELSIPREEQLKGSISEKVVRERDTTKISSEFGSSKTIDDQWLSENLPQKIQIKSPRDPDVSEPLLDSVAPEVETNIKESEPVTETVSVSKFHDETSMHIHSVTNSKLPEQNIGEEYRSKIESTSEITEKIENVQDVHTKISSEKKIFTEGFEEFKLNTKEKFEAENKTTIFSGSKEDEDIGHTEKTSRKVETKISSNRSQISEMKKQEFISSEIEPSYEGLTSQINKIIESDHLSSQTIIPLHEEMNSSQKVLLSSRIRGTETSTGIIEYPGDQEVSESSVDHKMTSPITQTMTELNSYIIINQPRENVDKTIWEVSVESELLKEEKLTSLPTSFEGDYTETKSESTPGPKYFDENTTDSTNLESEKLNQDRFDSSASNKLDYDGHDDMKRIILESLHQQKVDPEEARIIANSLIEEIESEIQKVERFNKGLSSKSDSLESEKHVTDYLKELAESKGLDQREVELVESVLERRQRQISKLSRGDTQASSMEITDEDLRYSETDYDYSNILKQQMGQLEAEHSDHLKNVYDSLVEDQSSINASVNHAAPLNKNDQDVNNKDKDDQMKIEKTHMHPRDIILEEDENFNESSTDELSDMKIKPAQPDSTELHKGNIDPFRIQRGVVISANNNQELNELQPKEQGEIKRGEIPELSTDIQFQEMHTVEKYFTDEKDSSKGSIKRTSSSDSKSSFGSSKTPEDLYSTCSSKKIDSETSSEVVFRESKEHDNKKRVDRKSGIDLEAYSSSGESHYHSFEIDNKSRPCSSDIEGILPAGSSEYESALNSQDLSMKSQMTSAEYHTAISSLSSKESMMSIESESSGNLASIEVSETSETLVPTNSDLEGDLDMVDQQMFDDSEVWPSSSEFECNENKDQMNQSSSHHSSTENVDIPFKMKRSHEMTFQPEPRVLATDSPHIEPNDIEEKLGTSLDDGSALSVSLSSTSSGQLRTVIELSRTESGGPEESLTSAIFDHVSLDDDIPIKYPENIVFVDSSTSTNTICKESIESVTILSSTITDNGVSSVCSQVTTETATYSEAHKPNHEELKKKGHRRQESTSFIPSLIHGVIKPSEPQTLFKIEQKTEDGVDGETPIEKIERGSIEKAIDLSIKRESSERRDSHGKSSSTSSEKSSFEEAEAEAAFNMVAHISPVHKIKQICPIIEDIDAEKIESEAKERAERAKIERTQQLRDASPGSIPDIKVTEHMAPLDESSFRYPELEIEREELEQESRRTQDDECPMVNETEKPIETEDIIVDSLEDDECEIKEEPSKAPIIEEKVTKEVGSISEDRNDEDRASDSPNSDSFELVDRPDIIDDFVVIEEIGKEASEMDSEGKSMAIQSKSKSHRKRDEEIDAYLARSDPTPLTKMTELKYFPDTNYELEFEFEESPPQPHVDTITKDYGSKYDKELEANRKWIEQQFHGDHAAMTAAGYGYEMEFERGPLEDIKEEDINDIDLASSRIGSLGSQKDSGGSGSVKDSYSSTPEYDVLAGRRYFTRSGEHDDISMSSLQEFENLERAMSLETKRIYHGSGSQESSSNGSFKTRYYSSKGQGDDISVSSLKEFEGLEKACIAVYKTEIKVKEEEALLSHIDELQEILPTESETIEEKPVDEIKMSESTDKIRVTESDEEDYEKRMFEIDEIIRQAQNNVEKFAEMKEPEKTESLGRGDSIEEVSKVPDLDLDAPVSKCTVSKDDNPMVTSTDSLDFEQNRPLQYGSTDSLDQKNPALDIMTASTDSMELNNQLSKNITTDSMENKTETSNMVCSDSLDIAAVVSSRPQIDSLEEDEPKTFADHSSSDTGKDFSSSVRDDIDEQLHELMLGSTDSLEPTSSTATHATYQYETDSVFSGSFTSGGSNTMISSTDTIDPNPPRESIDIAAAVREVWFDKGSSASEKNTISEFFEESSIPYVTEVIEPSDDPAFSHTIHRRIQMPMEVRKVTFHGEEADKQLDQFIKDFGGNEEVVHETGEIDVDGNVHTRKMVQKRFIIRSRDEAVDSGETIRSEGDKLTFNACPAQLTTLTKTITGETSQPHEHSDTLSSKDQQECSSEKEDGQMRQQPIDQHRLSSEKMELLKKMEEESKK